ncbi:MAG TPA: NADP-dependent oxidoreductase [Terriglobales bacterium]|jgi:NADPH:quinone reductase-like Zn-dependent oxidoreductase|nr:NADP-dependent oxidoreductase [Terriglobales bacterium]
MKAGRIHKFGGPDVILIDEIPRPAPKEGELVVRVAAAGVAPWDVLIRENKSVIDLSLPIILGSDLSGVVESVGAGVTQFTPGDEIFGVTNKQFCGAYAEYAVASAELIARKPKSLSFQEAASAPVVAVTAWQMLFEYAQLKSGQSVLIHGAAGNVGAYAVQLAKHAGLQAHATAGPGDLDYVRSLGADTVANYRTERFEDAVPKVDAVLDMVGGETQHRSFSVLKPNGILVSVVTPSPEQHEGFRSVFFLVDVTTARLDALGKLFDDRKLVAQPGSILPLKEARKAHEMLAGAPHKRGKILLTM